jgi:hypothetical protein
MVSIGASDAFYVTLPTSSFNFHQTLVYISSEPTDLLVPSIFLKPLNSVPNSIFLEQLVQHRSIRCWVKHSVDAL